MEYKIGSAFDIQKELSNIPVGFTTGRYTGELHIPGYNFAGQFPEA